MKSILVIEDDLIMRENIAELLDLAGYKVASANDGKEGLDKARQQLPDLIICDIKMPEIDGYTVLHILAQDQKTAGIPFIFVTAKTEMEDLRKGMELGADDYITKPFEDSELLKAVETRLKKSAMINKQFNRDSKGLIEFLKEAEGMVGITNRFDEDNYHTYSKGDTIYSAGDQPHYVFFLIEGKIKASSINPDGKELISAIFEGGDYFGYQALFEERTYHESAEALETIKLHKIPRDDFFTLINQNRIVANKFISMISRDLTEKSEELMRMAYDSVKKRLAIKLLELMPEEADQHITISRTDLAALLGTSLETLVRSISDLRDMGIIETDPKKITLLDRDRLLESARAW
jgi:CheY-like chemotaxis protein/CRP-like cAMP-binding protein